MSVGTFTLSLDTELIWGSFDHMSEAEFERRFPDVRSTIREVIRLLERYEVAATWAVVGHLFLSECRRSDDGQAHPELARPRQRWRPGDWYADDPCTGLDRNPLWYGPDVLDMIQAAKIEQDIGCHSFSHALYGDPELTREAVDADLEACVRLARERGIELRSFVFPRNSEGHHQALLEHGFRAYRGVEPTRYRGLPVPVHRTAHLATHLAGTAPPVSKPHESLPGLWNIPGSSLILHREGLRRMVSMSARLRRARAGIREAERSGGVFHLWTHPLNLANDPAYLLKFLDGVLREAAAARDRGSLYVETMADLAERLSGSASPTK